MKNLFSLLITGLFCISAFSQETNEMESTGLPGDHFDLQGALDLFQKAESPEDFERLINTEANHVNNLDINGDGEIDYVKVISKNEGNVHVFVLQVPLSENENQDIAVIELEKTKENEAGIQIIGDEDIYGEEIILEPSDTDDEQYNYSDKDGNAEMRTNPTIVNVWMWPSVRYVYTPAYRPWVSTWRWRSYPVWWKPWRPLSWSVWHPFRLRNHTHFYRIGHTHRAIRAHNIYRPGRVTSVSVRTRYAGAHNNYKISRSKTKITGPRGNTVTKKNTTIKGPGGKVKASKTTVKRSRKN